MNGKKHIIREVRRDYSDENDKGNYRKDLKVSLRQFGGKTSIFLGATKKIELKNSILRIKEPGLVGIKIWDKDSGEANITLRSFRADSI